MRTLLIDNYDSFTYNLYQLISEVNGVEPTVVRNDETDPAALDLAAYDNIVVSPGPGRPDRTRDVGLSAAVIDAASQPLLGVCLGHQGIVVAAGGRVDRAPVPRHGFLDRVGHDGRDLFAGLPQDFTVVRYHSLCALEPLPPALEVTARTPDGVIMGVRHRQRPQWGVQFHPESVAGEFGAALLRNFAELTLAHGKRARRTRPAAPVTPARPAATDRPRWRLRHEVIERAVDTEAAFLRLYGASPTAFWLDSEHVEPGLDRFSFLGDASGPLAEVVRYRVGEDVVRVEDAAGTRTVAGDVLGYLSTQLRERHVELPALPFDFVGGYVGYLGYEVKADCGARAAHRAATPDAQWIFADRLIVVDHVAGQTHLVALTDDDTAADQWLRETGRVLETLPAWANPAELAIESAPASVAPLLNRGRDRYLADIAACLEYLRAGESYEICLTDSLTVDAAIGGLDFYRTLRRCNPAPYAAYLRFDDLEIACSSPERFLKIDRARTVESKPIKGTAPRGATPAEDERLRRELADSPKTRAENLMIVDLLRNDLGRVCQIGSVHVPELMATESYSTVHQLVSTVRGTLRPDVDAIDCVRACFPGGSMTGAPKLRTMEIIDELEGAPRGVYSGTIGFLGLGGTADLNIVIRTAVRHDGRWQIGAGGAIVLDSDPAEEYREMLWKAAATQRAATAAAATSR
ncbi:aminodeoxychorismate synthase component I [Nocardia farcinica]|uniref:aminodeoxychorismate synthase component I n=2 Tax=Nocardia TaxID=1817 RepID=UPI000A38857C|nr:aminodeoxychorismate synthase component I [Nocardia farcinica]MBA4855198.1 aminodeoxychorismate synthase component I [Nocardia farcinica]MBC9817807.1 aminodeoxychorismate synthase component I [Nocardia farcinica]